MDDKVHANVQDKSPNNQADLESHGSMEYHTNTAAFGRKDRATKGKIRRGIFQGDSFSPLLFNLALDLQSNLIWQGHGYTPISNKRTSKDTRKVTHILRMDDLKLFAPNDKKLAEQLK